MQTTEDYRLSHLQRGSTYDATLAESPFDAYMADWERMHLQRLIPALFPAGAARYLDFACGTGRILGVVAPFAREVVAVDVSPSMIEQARQRVPKAQFQLRDLTTDPVDLGSFELMTAFRFFGNAQDELRDKVLAALVARLAPGGRLVINNHRNPRALHAVFDKLTGGDADGTDLHVPKMKALLARHGLRVEQIVPIGTWMYRSRMLGCVPAASPVSAAREARFSRPALASISPDMIVVARRD
jgi:SAM-dependent methyltransferase